MSQATVRAIRLPHWVGVPILRGSRHQLVWGVCAMARLISQGPCDHIARSSVPTMSTQPCSSRYWCWHVLDANSHTKQLPGHNSTNKCLARGISQLRARGFAFALNISQCLGLGTLSMPLRAQSSLLSSILHMCGALVLEFARCVGKFEQAFHFMCSLARTLSYTLAHFYNTDLARLAIA